MESVTAIYAVQANIVMSGRNIFKTYSYVLLHLWSETFANNAEIETKIQWKAKEWKAKSIKPMSKVRRPRCSNLLGASTCIAYWLLCLTFMPSIKSSPSLFSYAYFILELRTHWHSAWINISQIKANPISLCPLELKKNVVWWWWQNGTAISCGPKRQRFTGLRPCPSPWTWLQTRAQAWPLVIFPNSNFFVGFVLKDLFFF